MKYRRSLFFIVPIFVLISGMTFALAGCNREKQYNPKQYDQEGSDGERYNAEGGANKGIDNAGNADKQEKVSIPKVEEIIIASKGYYYVADHIMHFYSKAYGIDVLLCSKANCKHKDSYCDAYVDICGCGSSDISQNYGNEVLCCNDKLYMQMWTGDNEYCLYQYDSNFHNKKEMTRLSSFPDGQAFVPSAGVSMVSGGYLYYMQQILKEAEGGQIYIIDCMRIKPEKDAKPEYIGKIEFQSEKSVAEGKSGHTLGKRGENLKSMCTTQDGVIYALTEEKVIVLDFNSNAMKEVYFTDSNGSCSLAGNILYDGKYLYFAEIVRNGQTSLIAADTEGNIVGRTENVADINIELVGFDDENILISAKDGAIGIASVLDILSGEAVKFKKIYSY